MKNWSNILSNIWCYRVKWAACLNAMFSCGLQYIYHVESFKYIYYEESFKFTLLKLLHLTYGVEIKSMYTPDAYKILEVSSNNFTTNNFTKCSTSWNMLKNILLKCWKALLLHDFQPFFFRNLKHVYNIYLTIPIWE